MYYPGDSQELPMDGIRVLLVEDHLLVRHATKLLIQQDPSVIVVGEAADLSEALGLVKDVMPHVALIDIRLRNSSGIDLAAMIKRRYPWVKVLALTAFDHEQYARAMARVGVEGYLMKDISGAELLEAIHAAHEGRPVMSSWAGSGLIAHEPRHIGASQALPKRPLTAREMEILEMLQGSLSGQEIAERLRLSPKTIHTHLSHILAKLGQPTLHGAVESAVTVGLLTRVDAGEAAR